MRIPSAIVTVSEGSDSHSGVSRSHRVPDAQPHRKGKLANLLVVGTTGVGKSSFIRLAAGKGSIVVSDTLESGTSEIQASDPVILEDAIVTLFDSPSLDGTNTTVAEGLVNVAQFLKTSRQKNLPLDGVLLLLRISDNRLPSNIRESIELYRALFGKAYSQNIIIVTTMWDATNHDFAERREKDLKSQKEIKALLEAGATMKRHYNTAQSAIEVIKHVTGWNKPPLVMLVQTETVDEGRKFAETTAGRKYGERLEQESDKLRNLGVAAKADELLRGGRAKLDNLLDDKEQKFAKRIDRTRERAARGIVGLTACIGVFVTLTGLRAGAGVGSLLARSAALMGVEVVAIVALGSIR